MFALGPAPAAGPASLRPAAVAGWATCGMVAPGTRGRAAGVMDAGGRGGGAGAQPQFQVHVHIATVIAGCWGDDVPDAQSVVVQIQFQIHVVGSVPDTVGAPDGPVPVGVGTLPVVVPRPPGAMLDCVIGPSSPGLLMRITTARFVGAA